MAVTECSTEGDELTFTLMRNVADLARGKVKDGYCGPEYQAALLELAKACDAVARFHRCEGCEGGEGATRHSFGVYAGFLCEACAIEEYVDACGLLDGQQGDPADLDEPYDGEEGGLCATRPRWPT